MKQLHRRLLKIEKSRNRDLLPALAMGKMCFFCGSIIEVDDDNECGSHSLLPDAMHRIVLRHIVGEDGDPLPPIPGVHRTIRVKHEIGQTVF